MTKKVPQTTLIVLSFFAIYVVWGSTYLLNKVAVTELPPFMLAAWRFVTAGTLIFLICISLGISLKVNAKEFINTIVAGFFFLTLGNGLAVWALRYLDSGFEALLISAQPLIVLFLMWVLQGKKIQPRSMIGVVLGAVGMYLLVGQNELAVRSDMYVGIAMIFVCMFSWGYGSLFVGKAELPKNFLVNTGYQMITGGIMLGLISPVFGEPWSLPHQWSPRVLWAMLLLVIFGSIVAFTAFNYLLRTVSPDKVSTNTYVNPVIAMLLGWYILGEKITGQSLVAAVVLLTGVYFINSRKKLVLYSRFSKPK